MKKLLLGLSCAAAMMISLNVSANPKKQAVKKATSAARGAEAATAAGRAVINQGTQGAQINQGVNATRAGMSTADSLLSANSAGAEKAQTGAMCNQDSFGGVNTADASKNGVLGVSACSVDLSVSAKKLAGLMSNAAESVRQSFGVSLKNATIQQKGQMMAKAGKKMSADLGLSFNESMDRIGQICSQCGIFSQSLCQKNVLQAARN